MKFDLSKYLLGAVFPLLTIAPVFAADNVLKLTFFDQTRTVKASELLARKDAKDLTIPNDAAYGMSMT
jgi:hypothetical protein